MRLRPARAGDADAIAHIYGPYVTDSAISFETEAPAPAEIARRIEAAGPLYPWIAATDAEDRLVGYAYATAYRVRSAYRFAVESSVYVDPDNQGRGAGSLLYDALLSSLERQGFVQAIAVIALPNAASIAFHERLGFVHAGTNRQVGYKLGRWHDIGLWQRPLAAPAEPPSEPRPYDSAWLSDDQRR